jgi:hypothetical protein
LAVGASPWDAGAILDRGQESPDHFGLPEIAFEAIEFVQPEVEAAEVSILPRIRIATEVSKVLHENESSIEVAALKH